MMPTPPQDTAPQGKKRRAASSSSSDQEVHPLRKKWKSHSSSSSDQKVHPRYKKRKSHSSFPPEFYDGLLKIVLCKSALNELDRRNGCRSKQSTHIAHILPPSLGHFARQGGPDLSHLRGFQAMSFRPSLKRQRGLQSGEPRTDPTRTGTRTTTQNALFEQHLFQNNIFIYRSKYPDGTPAPTPDNIAEIRLALAQPRTTLVTNDDFNNFIQQHEASMKKESIILYLVPLLEGTTYIPWEAKDIKFSDLQLTDGTLIDANPDFCYGAIPSELDSEVRSKLTRTIIPSRDEPLILPNFFLDVNGVNGKVAVLLRQSCYHGAVGAMAMHSLQVYSQPDQLYDNKAYSISCTYQDGNLRLYTSHPIPPKAPNEKFGFKMTHITSYSLDGNFETFCDGIRAYRNAKDWAKTQRDNFIRLANEKVANDRQRWA